MRTTLVQPNYLVEILSRSLQGLVYWRQMWPLHQSFVACKVLGDARQQHLSICTRVSVHIHLHRCICHSLVPRFLYRRYAPRNPQIILNCMRAAASVDISPAFLLDGLFRAQEDKFKLARRSHQICQLLVLCSIVHMRAETWAHEGIIKSATLWQDL